MMGLNVDGQDECTLKIPLCEPNMSHQESVYGRRDAVLSGIAVVHQEKGNIYRKSPLWKQGVVDEIEMLPRGRMFKPDVP